MKGRNGSGQTLRSEICPLLTRMGAEPHYGQLMTVIQVRGCLGPIRGNHSVASASSSQYYLITGTALNPV
jgi:hypothetical protein